MRRRYNCFLRCGGHSAVCPAPAGRRRGRSLSSWQSHLRLIIDYSLLIIVIRRSFGRDGFCVFLRLETLDVVWAGCLLKWRLLKMLVIPQPHLVVRIESFRRLPGGQQWTIGFHSFAGDAQHSWNASFSRYPYICNVIELENVENDHNLDILDCQVYLLFEDIRNHRKLC